MRVLAVVALLPLGGGCGYISSELSWYSENSSFATISGSAPMFANASSASLTQSTMACSAATESVTVSLHQILEDGSIAPEALASGIVDGAGNFELTKVAIKEINIASSVGSNSILKASGCDMDFYKPLTDTKDQEISFASTVIALTTKVDDSGKVPLTDIDKSDLSQLESDLKVLSGSSLSQFTSALIANSALSQKFQGVFNINPGKLKELPPAKWSVTAPLQTTEASTTNYSVSINHWNQDYVPAYQWLLDGVEVSTSSSFVLTTNKNSQGTKSLVLKVGSAQAGVLNVSLPTKEQSFSITVADTYPAVAPSMTLVGADKRNFLSGQVQILTGASLANCTTFSRLALNESSLLPPLPLAANFPITCTSAGTQTENFMLSAGDGTKSLSLWALDSAGGISLAASSLNVTLDQTPPAVSLSNLNAEIKGGSVQSVVYTSSDATAGLNQIKLDYAADGVTFSEIADLSGVASPYAWTVPVVDQAAAKLRLRVSDLAGNATTTLSNAFKIDSTVPAVAITSPAENTRLQSAVTLAGTCENGSSVSVAGTGVSAAQVVACTAGAFSVAVTFTGGDGTKSVTASQTDPAGNIGSAARNFIRDSTPPALAIIGPAANTAAKNGVYLTGSCEHSSTYATQNTLTLGGTGLASPSSTTCLADGSFASSVLFAGGDGAKALSIAQTDQAGNITTVSRSFLKDINAVSLAISNPANNSSVQAVFSITGTCDSSGGASNVVIAQNAGTVLTGSPVNVNCVSGIFSQSVTVTSSDGAISVRVSQTDASSTLTNLDLNLTKDTVAPTPSITSPAVNTPAKNTVSLSGACENGLNINFAGTGIAATESLSCTDGTSGITCAPANAALCTYTKVVGLSAVDGTKNITVSQTDLAGNIGSVNRDFVRDNVAPTLSVTSHSNNDRVAGTVTLVGTCETGGANVVVSSTALSSSASVACTAGAFNSGLLTLLGPDALKTLSVEQNDVAGNTGSTSISLTRDTTAPVLVKLTPSDGASFKTTATLTGTCESGLSVVASGTGITGTPSDTCIAGAFSIAVTLSAGDGAKSITLTETDTVGNISTAAFNLIKDNVGPVLTQTTIAQNPHHSNTSSITFGGACETGHSVIVTGSESATRSCTAGAWTFSTNKTTDGTYSYNFAQTDEAGNSTSITAFQWVRDTVLPVIAWSTPSLNYPHQSQITATGSCENSLPIAFSGSGLLSSFTSSAGLCSGSSFSQTLFFSSGDGVKTITISQTDAAGNTFSQSRDFIRDTGAPTLTQTAHPSTKYANSNTLTFSGACESGLSVVVSGADTSSTSCSGSAWSYTTAAKTSDGVYNFTFTQTDAANNQTQISTQFVRDTIAPSLVRTSTNPVINAANSATWSGTCDSTANGSASITVTGAASSTISCTGNAWSFTDNSASNGTRNFSLVQTDAAGNSSSSVALSWTRDTTIPNIQLGSGQSVTVKNALNSVTWSGTCEASIANIQVTGADTQTIACSAGTWSYTPPTQSSDLSRSYTLTQTNSIPTSAQITLTWIRDTQLPTLASGQMSLNGGAPTTSSRLVQVALQATDTSTNISHFCLKTTTGTAPATPLSADSCWVAVNAPIPGLSLSLNLNLTGYGQSLDFADATYTVYAWVRDEVGNIATLSNSGNGTLGQDKASIQLIQGSPPSLSNVFAARTDSAYPPLLGSDEVVTAGNDIFIKWTASDVDETLGSQSIRIFFTTDDTNWSEVTTSGGVANGINGSCSLGGSYTGCYRWSSPSSSFLRLRVQATDSTNKVNIVQGNALNTSPLRIIAGNTNNGINGDARNLVIIKDPASSPGWIQPQSFVVTRTGDIYVRDFNLGIIKISAADGIARVFLRQTGAITGDNGSVSNATARYVVRLALDPQGRLVFWDSDRIRRINLNLSTPSIETIIGGGGDTSATVNNPLSLSMAGRSRHDWADPEMSVPFYIAQDNRIYFASSAHWIYEKLNGSTSRIRIYRGDLTSPIVESLFLGGTGMSGYPSQNLAGCGQGIRGLGFTSSGALDYIYGIVSASVNPSDAMSGQCAAISGTYTFSANPSTGQSLPLSVYPVAPIAGNVWGNHYFVAVTSTKGKVYLASRQHSRVYRLDYDKTGNSAGTLTLLFGNGATGNCTDGSLATGCSGFIDDIFIDENERLYIIDDGRIRYVKSDGTMTTVFGKQKNSSTTGLATNTVYPGLFGIDLDLSSADPKKIIATDVLNHRLLEITPGGNSRSIAGTGSTGWGTVGSGVASTSPFMARDWDPFSQPLVNPTNGIIYFARGSDIVALNRSLDQWTSTVIGGGGTKLMNVSDTIGSGVHMAYDAPLGNRSRPILVGINSTHLLFNFQASSPSTGLPENSFIFSSKHSDSFKTNKFAGTVESRVHNPSTAVNYVNKFCPAGTLTDNCRVPVGSEYNRPYTKSYYDNVDDKWIVGLNNYDSQVAILKSGVNVNIVDLGFAYSSIAYRRESVNEVIYFCRASDGNIFKKTIGGGAATALPWPSASIRCSGQSLLIDESRSVLIFPYSNNGLTGIAEYSL